MDIIKDKQNSTSPDGGNHFLLEHIRNTYSQFEEALAQLSILRELGAALLHINDFKSVCQRILEITIKNTVAKNCSVMLMDHDKNRLFLIAATNPDMESYIIDTRNIFSKVDVRYTFAFGEGVAGEAVAKKKPVLVKDVGQSDIYSLRKDTKVKIGTILSVPLILEDTVLGVLTLSHPVKEAFETSDINLFTIVANFAALAIDSTLTYQRLQYSEEKHRALAEYSNDGITIIQHGMHQYANPSYESLTGYSFKELRAIPFDNLISCQSDAINTPRNGILHNRDVSGTYEAVMTNKNGTKTEIEISHAPFLYEGRPAEIISVRDLGERKELENQLVRAQKMEAIGILAGGVAHDLNNILSGLVSYPELLLMGLPQDSPLRKPILTIQKSGEKAAAITQDLLTLARRGVAVAEVVNLNHIISEYLKSPEHEKLKSFHPEVQVETNLETELLNIMGSPVHLAKTVMNLVSNAAEAMSVGGKIVISTENRYVDRPIRGYDNIVQGDYVILAVSDTGVGISSEDIGRIFEPFYTKKVLGRSGTGLGMAVVWGTVKDHNGYIDVQSTEGKGTTVDLYFPVTRKELEKDKSATSIGEYMGNGESILVVDDVQEQREIASELLTKLGYSVNAVSSGEEAVEYMKTDSADLLILDMIMGPGIDGLDTYKKILELHPETKAVIASGFSETDRVQEAQRLGAGQYVKKPYTLEKIGLAVRSELEK
jgi:PAS domain S-box-containing protein